MDPKHPDDPTSPWYNNPDWVPPDGYQYYGYTWTNGQPELTPTNTPGSPGFDPNAPSLHQPNAPGTIGGTPPPAVAPPPSTTTGGTTPPPNTIPPGSLGSLLKPFDGTPAPYTNPAYPNAPTFPTIQPFTAPTAAEAAATPGQQFIIDQGRQQLEQSAAAKGVLNTGGTLQDILNYGQAAGNQFYQQDLTNAENIYGMNVANQLAPYAAAEQNYQMQYPQAASDAASKNAFNWNDYLQKFNIFDAQRKFGYNSLYGLASLGSGVQ